MSAKYFSMMKKIIYFLFLILCISCTNKKNSHDNIHFNPVNDTGVILKIKNFEYKKGIVNGKNEKRKVLVITVFNNDDKSIYFDMSKDSLIVPMQIRGFRDNSLMSESFSNGMKDTLIEILPNMKNKFLMDASFISKDKNSYHLLICYYLSPSFKDEKDCQKIMYRIEGEKIEKID